MILSFEQHNIIETTIYLSPAIPKAVSIEARVDYIDGICDRLKIERITMGKEMMPGVLKGDVNLDSLDKVLFDLYGLWASECYKDYRTYEDEKTDYDRHINSIKGDMFENYCHLLFRGFGLVERFREEDFKILEKNADQKLFAVHDETRDAVYEHKESGQRFNLDFKFARSPDYSILGNKQKKKIIDYHNFKAERGGTSLVISGVGGRPYLPDSVYIFPVPDLTGFMKSRIALADLSKARHSRRKGIFDGYTDEEKKEDEILDFLVEEEIKKFNFFPKYSPSFRRASAIEPFKAEQVDGVWVLK